MFMSVKLKITEVPEGKKLSSLSPKADNKCSHSKSTQEQ